MRRPYHIIMATVTKSAFELTGADDGPLRDDVRTAEGGSGRPAVVVCHGFKGFKDWGFFPHLASRIARAGFTAVSFNFSGSGVGPDGERFTEPERFGHATLSNDLEDLNAVCSALLEGTLVEDLTQRTALGIFGHSRGGGVAILYAAEQPACRALVTWAAIAETLRWDTETIERWRSKGKMDVVNTRTGEVLPLYRDALDDIEAHRDEKLNVIRAAATIDIPWLIIHGDQDESVTPSDGRRLHEAAHGALRELKLIPGGGHTFGARHPWAGSTAELDDAMDGTVGWSSRHLL